MASAKTANANRVLVSKVMDAVYVRRDSSVVEQHFDKGYIQHNPQAASGLPGVVKFFTQVLKQQPLPIQNPTKQPIVAVMAEGDYVTVLTVRSLKDAKGNPYTTTWFDTWRFVDGKADEHWDPATDAADAASQKTDSCWARKV